MYTSMLDVVGHVLACTDSYSSSFSTQPLHYACAYGASEEALYVLTDACDDAITTTDRYGRTPLHFALSNAGRSAAPSAVRLLLQLHKEVVNAVGDGPLPLRVLAEFANTVPKTEFGQKESVLKCLEHLLSFDPAPTAEFFSALQALPQWLQDRAVVMPVVQKMLNEKIAQRFPTGVLLSDLFFQLVVIGFYAWTVTESIKERLADSSWTGIQLGYVLPLYLGGTYFLARTLIRTFSLLALKAFRVLLYDYFFWLDVLYIFILYYWSSVMLNTSMDLQRFRYGTALSVSVIWLKLLGYLRNTYIDFAVFLSGLFHVVNRLAAFIMCLIIILLMFSLMFFAVYYDTDRCKTAIVFDDTDPLMVEDFVCSELELEPYCNRWSSFLHVFTMLLGKSFPVLV